MSDGGVHMPPDSDAWRIEDTAAYICDRKYLNVTAQFPDELLPHAVAVSCKLQRACHRKGHHVQVCVLADTTYDSLSVDEVAAAHVNADCVIHYGRASLTKLSRLPAYYVFPSRSMDPQGAACDLADHRFFSTDEALDGAPGTTVFVDQIYISSLPALQDMLYEKLGRGYPLQFARLMSTTAEAVGPCQHAQQACCDTSTCTAGTLRHTPRCGASPCERKAIDSDASAARSTAGYTWEMGGASPRDARRFRFLWIGDPQAPALYQLQLTYNTASWLSYDPETRSFVDGLPPEVLRMLRKRYYLVEKARSANVIGIVMGTLGASGYRDVLRQLRSAATCAGKKTYTLLIGKPNPAKLANFPEIEVFVLVADPQAQILDSKEYLAPIITPYEAFIAFGEENEWEEGAYSLDMENLLERLRIDGTNHRGDKGDELGQYSSSELSLAQRVSSSLQVAPKVNGSSDLVEVRSAADFLVHKRNWRGLEAPIVGAEHKDAAMITQGRMGRAAGYAEEGRDQE